MSQQPAMALACLIAVNTATLLVSLFALVGLLSAIFILPEVYGFEHD